MRSYKIEFNNVILKINQEIYEETCVIKAAYLFIDKFYVFIDKKENDIIVQLTPKKGEINKEFNAEEIAGEFNNELLNQKIRQKIINETKNIRELILARAMYSSFIDEPEVLSKIEENYSIENIVKDWFEGVDCD